MDGEISGHHYGDHRGYHYPNDGSNVNRYLDFPSRVHALRRNVIASASMPKRLSKAQEPEQLVEQAPAGEKSKSGKPRK